MEIRAKLQVESLQIKMGEMQAFFGHLARNQHFDNVTRRPGYSQGPSRFLAVVIKGMSFFRKFVFEVKRNFELFGRPP